MKKAGVIVLGVMFAAGLLYSSASLFAKTSQVPSDHVNYEKLVEDPAILNSNPESCANVVYQGDSKAGRSSQERCAEYRDEQLEKLRNAVSETDSSEILARLFLLVGRFHYANAYDKRSVESAELALGAFTTSLSHESGAMEEGFSEFGVKQREYYERALNLLETLKNEEEQKKKQESGSQPKENKAGGENDKDEGTGLPIVEPGVQP